MKSSHPRPTIHRSKHLGQYVRTVRALLLKTKKNYHHTPSLRPNQNTNRQFKTKKKTINESKPPVLRLLRSHRSQITRLCSATTTFLLFNNHHLQPVCYSARLQANIWLPATATIHMQRHPLESNIR